MHLSDFFQRLRERKLVRWGLAYLLFAAGFAGLLDALSEPLVLSVGIQRAVLVILGTGFLITLVLAWYHGERGRQRVSGAEILILTGLVVAGAEAVAIVGPTGSGSPAFRGKGDDGRPYIAVLPFDNMSPDPYYDFFADGVQEELTTKLQGIPTLHVISRTTADSFEDPATRPPIPEIAALIGADFLIEGSARIAGDSVWITVQLIEGASDLHRWAETYGEAYTPEGYYRLQAEIVQRIASDLRLPISPEDKAWLEAVPTANLEAFEAYMQGREAYLAERRGAVVSRDFPSTRLLERAVELDPRFAMAYAILANLYLRSNQREPEEARRAAERALQLGGEIPEARLALMYYYAPIDLPEAERQLELAVRAAPDNPEVIRGQALGFSHEGDADRAFESLRRGERLNPLDPFFPRTLGEWYHYGHRYDEALAARQREASLLDPGENAIPLLWQAKAHLARGDTARARIATLDLLAAGEAFPYLLLPIYEGWVVVRFMRPEDRQVAFDAFTRRMEEGGSDLSCSNPDVTGYCLRKAVHESEVGSAEKALIYWDSLRALLPQENAATQMPWVLSQVLIYMNAGEKESAIETARAAVKRAAPEGCGGYGGVNPCQMLARVLAHFGEHDEAIDLLEEMLPAPSWLTVNLLEIDPVWDPLRDHPRFQALLERYADDVEH